VLVATALAITFSVASYPSPTPNVDTFNLALRQVADRLVALQRPDGSWPVQVAGSGDLATSGRPARALLVAHELLRDPRYLRAAEVTADAIARSVKSSRRLASTGNLLLLAEMGRAGARPDLVALAAEMRAAQLRTRGGSTAAGSAVELMGRENRTAWLDGAWRNYLLWHGGEMVELARAVGDDSWADSFAIAVAGSWAPKRDHAWWTMGAGRMLEALAPVDNPEAQRLAEAELGALRNNELMPGLPWNDTPYDSYVYTMESAAALQGMIASRNSDAREAALAGLAELVRRQAPTGGWAATLSLLRAQAVPGQSEGVAAPELGLDETPELDAEMALTLAAAIRAVEAEAARAQEVASTTRSTQGKG
jgi:hypothetical protein